MLFQNIEAEDDFISVANSDIAQLCAENILLWQQFLDAFTCKIPILQHLAKLHHQLRVISCSFKIMCLVINKLFFL